MEDKTMSRIKSLLFLLVLAALVPLASATVTYVVGTCKPSLPSKDTFISINAALDATPAPNVVQVCPGTYAEEIGIFKPVTLEGISSGNLDQVVITVPSGGMFIDGGDDLGDFVAAQIIVQGVTGEVKLSNLTIDATGNNITSSGTNIVGVFFQNSSGTVNHLSVQNQNGNGGLGIGIWLEGGSANPSVTVENNNVQNFDDAGIFAETNSSGSELTATIKGNDLAPLVGTTSLPTGIYLKAGLTASVTGNLITGSYEGVLIDGGKGSVSGNKAVSNGVGIDIETDGVSVTTNAIYTTSGGYDIGIIVNSAVAPVTGNTIVQAPIGIFFDCVAGTNVHSNTILDSTLALYEVPSGTVGTNTYYNVGTINAGGC
jgi:putative cofactor-binding repeat protein